MVQRLKIVVMLGGPSAEREVSLRSGAGVVKALRSLGHSVVELDPKTPDWILPPDTEVVCLAPLHGTYGEDGTVQRQLEKLGVLYTGCDAVASEMAFNKIKSKVRFEEAGVPTAKYWWADTWTDNVDVQASIKSWAEEAASAVLNEAKLSLPLVVKPSCQGSSVGLQFVERAVDLPNAIIEAFKFNSPVLIEEKIIGRETTVGILDGKALPIVEVRPKVGSYDYKNKYTAGATEYFCPADFDAATTKRIQDAALGAFHAIGGRDYARVDVMVREVVGQASSLSNSGQARCLSHYEPVVLEVNTLPGMTETSLLPKAAAAAGLSYEELCQRMIDLALTRKIVDKLDEKMGDNTTFAAKICVATLS
jgi:D-alanine-D-alanine ligase